jgi:hypothetical protein
VSLLTSLTAALAAGVTSRAMVDGEEKEAFLLRARR